MPLVVLHEHLLSNHRLFTLTLDPKREQTVEVREGRRILWRGIRRGFRPWKLAVADLDGDRRKEILVGLHKPTHNWPEPHNCLFVFGTDGTRVFPKWRGSSMGRRFDDFLTGHEPGARGATLYTLERRLDGARCVTAWRWNGFGFNKEWERGAWKSATLVRVHRGRVVVRADGKSRLVSKQKEQ